MRNGIQQRYEAAVNDFQRFLDDLEAQERKRAHKGLLTRLLRGFLERREKQTEKLREKQRRRAYEVRKDQ